MDGCLRHSNDMQLVIFLSHGSMDECGRGRLKKGCLLLAEGIKSISDTGESSRDEGLAAHRTWR